ncbi:MAG: hypothetical protein ABIP44_08155 [Pseudoxanthomonas sp.]
MILILIGILGAALAIGIWLSIPLATSNPKISDDKKSSNIKSELPPTIHNYFQKDFPDQLSVSYVEKMISAKTSQPCYDVEVRLCYNFSSNSKALLFYFPKSNRAFSACEHLASYARDIINKIDSAGTVEQKMPSDLSFESSKDLVFTGKVYIYIENEFSLEELGRLEGAYKANCLSPVFRGITYATGEWLQTQIPRQPAS